MSLSTPQDLARWRPRIVPTRRRTDPRAAEEAAADFLAVKFSNCLFSIFLRSHFHKTKAA